MITKEEIKNELFNNHYDEDQELDSLDFLELCMLVEEIYGIFIEDDVIEDFANSHKLNGKINDDIFEFFANQVNKK